MGWIKDRPLSSTLNRGEKMNCADTRRQKYISWKNTGLKTLTNTTHTSACGQQDNVLAVNAIVIYTPIVTLNKLFVKERTYKWLTFNWWRYHCFIYYSLYSLNAYSDCLSYIFPYLSMCVDIHRHLSSEYARKKDIAREKECARARARARERERERHTPVSYTHLDVYKRQEHIIMSNINIRFIVLH